MNVQRHAQKLRRKVFEQKLVMCPLLDKTSFPCIAFPWKKYCMQIACNLKKILNAGKQDLKISILRSFVQYFAAGFAIWYAGVLCW